MTHKFRLLKKSRSTYMEIDYDSLVRIIEYDYYGTRTFCQLNENDEKSIKKIKDNYRIIKQRITRASNIDKCLAKWGSF